MNWAGSWSVMAVMFFVTPLIMIWLFATVDLFQRQDLSSIGKVAWLIGIIFLPFFGAIIYYLLRPAAVVPRGERSAEVADTLAALKYLLDSGGLSDADYQRQHDRIVIQSYRFSDRLIGRGG